MIIPIRHPRTNYSGPIDKVEWVLLELNGELIKPQVLTPANPSTSSVADVDHTSRRVEFGSIQLDASGNPSLIVGNHELKGTLANLKEPFAILRKRKLNEQPDAGGGNNEGASMIGTKSKLKRTCGIQYEVAGIVKKKAMFDQYPKSIMR